MHPLNKFWKPGSKTEITMNQHRLNYVWETGQTLQDNARTSVRLVLTFSAWKYCLLSRSIGSIVNQSAALEQRTKTEKWPLLLSARGSGIFARLCSTEALRPTRTWSADAVATEWRAKKRVGTWSRWDIGGLWGITATTLHDHRGDRISQVVCL